MEKRQLPVPEASTIVGNAVQSARTTAKGADASNAAGRTSASTTAREAIARNAAPAGRASASGKRASTSCGRKKRKKDKKGQPKNKTHSPPRPGKPASTHRHAQPHLEEAAGPLLGGGKGGAVTLCEVGGVGGGDKAVACEAVCGAQICGKKLYGRFKESGWCAKHSKERAAGRGDERVQALLAARTAPRKSSIRQHASACVTATPIEKGKEDAGSGANRNGAGGGANRNGAKRRGSLSLAAEEAPRGDDAAGVAGVAAGFVEKEWTAGGVAALAAPRGGHPAPPGGLS